MESKHRTGTLFGMINNESPSRTEPDSTLPITVVPMSLNLSMIGNLKMEFKIYQKTSEGEKIQEKQKRLLCFSLNVNLLKHISHLQWKFTPP